MLKARFLRRGGGREAKQGRRRHCSLSLSFSPTLLYVLPTTYVLALSLSLSLTHTHIFTHTRILLPPLSISCFCRLPHTLAGWQGRLMVFAITALFSRRSDEYTTYLCIPNNSSRREDQQGPRPFCLMHDSCLLSILRTCLSKGNS